MTKKLAFMGILLAGTILTSPAMANSFDADNYEGTLTRLGLLPPVGSGYDLRFDKIENPLSSADYKFITYGTDTDGNITPTYYNYTYELKADAKAIKKPRLNNSGTIDDANGYYFDIVSENAGAVENTGKITNGITADFVGNNSTSLGGAVYNTGTIGGIKGDFINNFVSAEKWNTQGGAIYNEGSTGDITGNFIGNYVSTLGAGNVEGGAIYNKSGSIGKVTGNFISNFAYSKRTNTGFGGAVYNSDIIGNISGSFISNYATNGGAIYNKATIGNIDADFADNYIKAILNAEGDGGAIYNNASIQDIKGDFVGNYTDSKNRDARGGAIYNGSSAKIESITGDFIGNHSVSESASAFGGALYNKYGIVNKISNSSFINNYAKGKTDAKGGAIYFGKDLIIEANKGVTEFTGNYVDVDGVKTSNAIYMAAPANTLTFNSTDSGTITVNDGIDGVDGYKIKLTGDDTGAINFNNHIKNAIINQDSGNTSISKVSYLNNNNTLNINGGNFSLHTLDADVMTETTITAGALTIADLGVKSLNFNNLHLNGGQVNVKNMSVDLQSGAMGSIWASTISGNSTKFVVENINILKDDDGDETSIEFSTNKEINNNLSINVTSALSPVFKYGVSYDPATGEFIFVRPTAPKPDDVNPEVLVPSVAAVAAVSVLSDEIYSRVLSDIDSPCGVSGCSRAVGGAFVKTFGSNDSVDLKGFSGADTQFNGIIGGVESERINEGKGISAVYQAYAAYADGESKFDVEKVDQSAYYLGVGATFYKGNAFLGTTANLATVRNEAKNSNGKDKFNSYLGGAAFKLGYNYEIAGLVVQPNLYASYTFINSNNYTTGRGARVNFDNSHSMEVAPGLKVAKEFEGVLTAYAKARYVHSFNEGQEVHANGFLLPEISLKPYVEYGLGVEKKLERVSGFAEITRRDGGREGWNGLLGLKYHW